MSTSGLADLFAVTLRQLSPDLKKASYAYPEIPFGNIPASRLLKLLTSAEALAPHVAYPAVPEIRIVAPSGQFVVQFKDGRLKLVSWAKEAAGGELSAEQIGKIIVGESDLVEPRGRVTAGAAVSIASPGRWRQYFMMTLLGLGILGCNVFTVWILTRPPRSILPKYKLLEKEPAERLLASVAG